MNSSLVSRDSKGKLRVVFISCEWNEEQHGYVIQRLTGTYNGKLIEQPELLITKGKVKRTVTEQAELEFNSHVKKYKDKGYRELDKQIDEYTENELNELVGSGATNQVGILKPMLAKQADKVTNSKIYDADWLASRKIDGTRCLFYYNPEDDAVHSASRGGEHYDSATSHLRENPILLEIFRSMPYLILDGELYKHGKSLQQISGAARMEKNAYDCDWLEYYIYDLINLEDMNMSARDRISLLNSIKNAYGFGFDPYREWNEGELQVQVVPQDVISGWDNMKALHDSYVQEGFEGLVIRNPERPYKPNGRTNDMIKIKMYKSEDFLVVGIEPGLRGAEDMVFVLETSDGKQFKAKPLGDRALKDEYWENFEEKYKGHMGECKFFYYSDDNVPLQPVFKIFRFDLE